MSAKRSNTLIMDLNEIDFNLGTTKISSSLIMDLKEINISLDEVNPLLGLLGVYRLNSIELNSESSHENDSHSSEADYEHFGGGDKLSACFAANLNINKSVPITLTPRKNSDAYSAKTQKRIRKGFQTNSDYSADANDSLTSVCTPQKSSVPGLEELVGLADIKQKLREAILFPIKYPHLFEDSGPRTAWSSALLFGPPGVGKTALVNAIASEAKLPLTCLTSSDLMSSWFGETEKNIRTIFSELKRSRCLVFIDEIDAICRQRTSQDTEQSRRMKSELLVSLDNNEKSGMFLICATNCPWDIDPAFLRRFQQQIYVPVPDREAREGLFLKYLKMGRAPKGWKNWDKILDESDGLTGCDVKLIVRSASMVPLAEMQKAQCWEVKADGRCVPSLPNKPNTVTCGIENLPPKKVWCRQMTTADLSVAMGKHIRTLNGELLEQYENYMKTNSIL